jgi:hypothetical protein
VQSVGIADEGGGRRVVEDHRESAGIERQRQRLQLGLGRGGEIEAGTARIANLDVSGLWTSSWSLSAQHKLGQGVIRFSAAQPRRAEGGELAFEAPVFLTKEGRLIYETRIAGLTPSGRELDLETAWSTRLGDMTTFEAAAALSLQPNHVARAEAETAFWVSLRHFW